jgi:hypothetical protein
MFGTGTTMNVKVLTSIAGEKFYCQQGEVFGLPAKVGRQWIANGTAEPAPVGAVVRGVLSEEMFTPRPPTPPTPYPLSRAEIIKRFGWTEEMFNLACGQVGFPRQLGVNGRGQSAWAVRDIETWQQALRAIAATKAAK